MNSLLLSMPGSPIIYYGDEIGMGDNIYLGDRNGVRTPMQWSPDRNAGFSRADPQRLYLPPIMDPIYGYEAVNVEAQLREPSSLLNWMRRLLAVRKQLPRVRPRHARVPAARQPQGPRLPARATATRSCCASRTSSRTAQPVELDLSQFKGRVPVELIGRTPFPPIGELPVPADAARARLPLVPARRPARSCRRGTRSGCRRDDLPVLVLFDGWASLFRDRVVPWRIAISDKVRTQLEREVLPAFIGARRWFAGKGQGVRRVELTDYVEWKQGREALAGAR